MKLYITGGGTGGHVTPGLAIARYFEKKQPQTTVRFAGSARGIENKLVPREGYPLDTIEIIGMSRSMSPKGILHNLKAAKLAVSAVSKAKKLLKQAKPDCVIGCGGYASFAVVRAAQQLGIPTVLLEVNALPGKVTQMLAKDADRVLVCFEQAKELLGGGDKIILTGAPVRGEILAADRVKAREKFGLTDDDQLVDVGGGGAGKPILPGLDGLHEALVASQITDLYPVPHQRTDALPAEFSSGPALQQPLRRADVVEAAEGLFNAAPAQKLTT